MFIGYNYKRSVHSIKKAEDINDENQALDETQVGSVIEGKAGGSGTIWV